MRDAVRSGASTGRTTQPSLAGVVPDRAIFAGQRYAPLHLIQFGRGCRFACDFCAVHAIVRIERPVPACRRGGG